MSDTHPLKASALRIGGYVVIDQHPCKILKMSTSKTGKHGHAKVHIVGIDIFTKSKHELLISSTHNIDVPNVISNYYELSNIEDDGFLSLMTDDGTLKEDLSLPEDQELAEKIRDEFNKGKILMVHVQCAMNCDQVMSFKEEK